MTATPAEMIDALKIVSADELRKELERLQAVEKWARDQLGFAVGDRVRIREDWIFPGDAHGWRIYKECLTPGATAVVRNVRFYAWNKPGWRIDIVLDRQWSAHEPEWLTGAIRRYWEGPVSETPEGYVPPSKYNQEHYPEGHKGIFMFNSESLEKVANA